MSLKTHATIILDIQDELGGNTTDFTSALLTKKLAEGLQEFSRYVPYIVRETLAVTEDSKELNISAIDNLLWIDSLEYLSGQTPRQFPDFTEHYRNTISMEIDSWPGKTDTNIDTAEALDASETGVDVSSDATDVIEVGTIILIENEQMYVSVTGSTLTVVRGYNQTTAATHVTNTDIYIPGLVYLHCAKAHYVPAITDLVGAVDLTAGYTAGVRTIHVDTLGSTDTLLKDWLFTIAGDGTGTEYRLTEDTTLASTEGDITFTPGLAEAVLTAAVVTFKTSSLNPRLETLLIDLVASRAAISISTKLMIQVNDGGVSVPREMKAWGQEKLALTMQKLEKEAQRVQKPVVWQKPVY